MVGDAADDGVGELVRIVTSAMLGGAVAWQVLGVSSVVVV